jgi:RNA polymerase sigma factor (TIGR02999 family)
MQGDNAPVTLLLHAWRDGDSTALDSLIPLVYDELKRMAAAQLSREPVGQTLQPTALVHEAWLRLVGAGDPDFGYPDFHDSAHFRCVAARIMRRILVDRARARHIDKRNGGWRVDLDDSIPSAGERAANLVALDDALADLERQDAEKARILELKYFGGLTADEMAGTLGITLNRVNWQIRTAQAWLRRELESSTPIPPSNSA